MKRITRLMTTMAMLAAFILNGTFANANEQNEKDIVDTAVAAVSFNTLAAALGEADLIDALKGEGPFTVFAPTDDAFAKLPAGTVEELLKPENREKLSAILTYHVVPGRVMAKQVVDLNGATTLNGQRIDISTKDGVMVDGANVIKTDISCSNGVIHVIDNVILPADKNLAETAVNAGNFKTLVAAAKAAGLVDALTGDGPLTVFAPTDEAFAKLPEGTVASLLEPENKDKLVAILKYHVVSGRVYSTDALKAKSAETLQGSNIEISLSGGQAKVNQANLVATDIDASNGVIHVIDQVILPPEDSKISAADSRKMIEHAVSRGAHTFNEGNHAECAQIYMTTMKQMIERSEMCDTMRTDIQHVLTNATHQSCPTQQAWMLRQGLDKAYAQLREKH